MFYYSGKDISGWCIAFILFLIFVIVAFPIFNSKYHYIKSEKIIGYEIDEMRTPAGKIFYDTVGIIYKKGDSLFIRDTGAYTFKPKE
jgi:hypothetical protein